MFNDKSYAYDLSEFFGNETHYLHIIIFPKADFGCVIELKIALPTIPNIIDEINILSVKKEISLNLYHHSTKRRKQFIADSAKFKVPTNEYLNIRHKNIIIRFFLIFHKEVFNIKIASNINLVDGLICASHNYEIPNH